MADIDDQITALENTIASGTHLIEYADKKEEYRSQKEMERALVFLKKKKALSTVVTRRGYLFGFNPSHSKDLGR